MDRSRQRILPVLLLVSGLSAGCGPSIARIERAERATPLMKLAEGKASGGEWDAAIAAYERCMALHPDFATAHLDLALLLHDWRGDYESAVKHYRAYLELRPETAKRKLVLKRMKDAQERLILERSRYTVRAGDTLASIAADLYGDSKEWTRLYEANEAALSGSNRLTVGQVLVTPGRLAPAAGAEVRDER